ncbi:hypothetical protein MGYG_03655 [Nannizzia gypsea CBS 118893]|uniref:Uncharacterized protein n=1 Tax=Arthroderma gypseum (strain ATCC MYA-4604 / CBS 118893) TaxID=535722 RepID=E4UT35_ARTGP|nr:hypothetical protein MGYG_03655 [Nannizzia gypsea CBS 118893]EFR00648.1 hypothetical protein MGYG_03655 [Nannizzia gypsea CBS 118893]
MRPLAALLPLLAALLLEQTAGSPVLGPRQEASINSVNLVFNAECPGERQRDIISAWQDAVKLAQNVGKIDFDDWAAWEFFGPPQLLNKDDERNKKDYRQNIQAIFDNVKSSGQGWSLTPEDWKVRINVNCGPKNQDIDAECRGNSNTRAHTGNSKSLDGSGDQHYEDPSATMNLVICNSFFAYDGLDKAIEKNKGLDDILQKFDLRYYRNRADIILHEMMHSNRLTYLPNDKRHITDHKMLITVCEREKDNKELCDKKQKLVDAYGPENVKILARTVADSTASYVTTNANNFALYALSKYVQKEIGGGCGLSVTTNGTECGVLEEDFEKISHGEGDFGTTEEGDVPTVNDLEWTSDEQYPSGYIKQLKERMAMDQDAPAPIPSGPPLKCNGLGSNKYVSQSTLANNITMFCSDAVNQGVQDNGTVSISRNYNHGANDEVDISIGWPSGMETPFNEKECNNQMNSILDNCGGNGPSNPRGYNGGGTVTVGENVVYHITPVSARNPLPNEPFGGCDFRDKFAFKSFWVWGAGWESWDYGSRNGGLYEELKKCNQGRQVEDWKFSYGLGSDQRE